MRLQAKWSFYLLSCFYLICQTHGYYFDYLSPTFNESESNDSNESNEGLVSDKEYLVDSAVRTIDAKGIKK